MKRNPKKACLMFVLMLLSSISIAASDKITLTDIPQTGSFPIVTESGNANIVIDNSKDAPVVTTAAKMLIDDIKLVTGKTLVVNGAITVGSYPIIAGTVGSSKFVDDLVASGKIDVSTMKNKWEAYSLQTVDNPCNGVSKALVICGSTPRGTAYGLLELSRLMGVSPYVWWADVTPARKSVLYATVGKTEVGEPSVKYRGLFINDEDYGLFQWAKANMDKAKNNIGPNTYAKVCDLLLRLKANTLWPAMHSCSAAFWTFPENLVVAKNYDIVLGSSHCEQMLRDNVWEWNRFGGDGNNNWNFSTNSDMVKDYWAKRVAESRGYDAMYTLGMRGVHDTGINGYSSTADKVRGLTDIIAYQRQLIADSLGDPTTIPQIFIPYKEVLDAYNAGLKVPDDVTLCWVDDNHGYIRQLPTAAEQARSGGNGIYYHLSYLGSPASYLWITSVSPSLISYELTKGYNNGIRNLWIINVGDIKPAEAEFEFCMDLAWDVNAWTPEKAYLYNRYWAAKTFGEEYADEISDIKLEYYRLAAAGKPEHLVKVTYTNDEINERLKAYNALAEKVETVKGTVPTDLQDAFYEMIEYPVKGACDMNIKALRALQSYAYAAAGQRDSALLFASQSRRAYREIQVNTDKYNKETAGGKWNGIMNMKPWNHAQFNMPVVATADDVADEKTEVTSPERVMVDAVDYVSHNGNVVTMNGLGISGHSIAVWPMDMTQYTAATAPSKAPYADYKIRLKKGENNIVVRCLPSFPVNSSYDLRVGLSVNGGDVDVMSVKTTAEKGKWNLTSVQGFSEATFDYYAFGDNDEVTARVYFMDPGVVVSDIYAQSSADGNLDLTNQLIKNHDFEYKTETTLNPKGQTTHGIPYGWQSSGTLQGTSFGINNDATNYHGDNVCWILSKPMPEDFRLFQTISKNNITPGVYKVNCMLWTQNGNKGTCRLFANNNVQYYGTKTDYTAILTAGETNTYAGYEGGNSDYIVLRPMSVYVTVKSGEDLTIGIASSNKKTDGSVAGSGDPSGWFKVDNFTIERVGDIPSDVTDPDALTRQLIKNNDFEYGADGAENITSATVRGVPADWSINMAVADYPGASYGINADGKYYHGNNLCWFHNGDSKPMPDNFELFQIIPADKLTSGRYKVSCRLWAEDGKLGTCRLFANDNVQYYATEYDYENNCVAAENDTFANYISDLNEQYGLQEMSVLVDVNAGEPLKLGIRTSNMKSEGTRATGSDQTGWFKVDYFRIERVADVTDGIESVKKECKRQIRGVYNMKGQLVRTNGSTVGLPKGVYVAGGKKVIIL